MGTTLKMTAPTTYDVKEDEHSESSAVQLSPEHRAFLMDHHQTCDLDPLPSMDPRDPLNWPSWKVRPNLWLSRSG